MKTILKFLLLLLAFVLPTIAIAHDFEVDGIYYKKNGNTATVTFRGSSYNSYSNEYSGDVIIPATVSYNGTIYTVKSIGMTAFCECSGLTSITIPSEVTTIGDYAFWGCSGLISIIIPSGVTSICNYTFYNCSGLTSITIPSGVTTIGDHAFYNCTGLTSITIPSGVTTIGDYAFYNCSGLASITIPSRVSTISTGTFWGCSGLTSITIPSSVTSIDTYAFFECSGLTSITIPSGVTFIGNQAFDNCSSLTSITIPSGVTSVCDATFKSCSGLKSITIPESVTSICYQAFEGCSSLTSITIPESVTTIGYQAFEGCSSLTSITIPSGVTSIGDYAFENCTGLASITVNDENTVYDSRGNCNAIITKTNNELILGCKNTVIPSGVTSIGHYAFCNCRGLTSITIPSGVTSIGHHAFYDCRDLTSITITSGVTSIGDNAFSWCTGLTAIKIPSGVTSIGNETFYACYGMTSITIPESVTSIGNNAFCSCSGLTSITIPSGLTSIGKYAFSWCSGLTSITIPSGVTSIGDCAFKRCTAIETLNYNAVSCDDFNSTELCPFQNLNISTIHIGDSVKRIPAYFAYGLNLLTTINIPKSVNYIGNQAFDNVPLIQAVTCASETPPSWNEPAMFATNVYHHAPLYVPLGSEQMYITDQSWGQFISIIGIEIPDEVLATGISLNQSQMNLQAGSTSQLVATVLPDSATNKIVTWISSNPEIATVDTTGFVTAVAPGIAAITAMTTDGSNLSASCDVTVTENLSNYDNYLSMSDVDAFRGDTIVIPVKMTNETSIISFQTDIFLPEGLELLQEDGEYIIDPSERMTRTHSIMSNDVSNGAIRVLCYSSNYKPFTGNSGDDLFYITVKVADDAEGNYTIQLKNTLLTNTDFVDLAAPDVAANVNVKAYLLGDANNSGTVSITDVVVTAQYVLELNPQPFVFEAADANADGNITVADVSRIAWMVLNPTLNAPLRAPALWNNGDRMSAEDITLASGETRRVSILLDNEMGYNAFQLDLNLPEGLMASNFQLTDRAGSHTFDVNMLQNGNIRALCYSPALTAIDGHEGALLTFDVTAAGDVNGDILIDGIELVTADCQSVKLDAFTIGVNNASSVKESITGKAIAKIEYFNLAGQRMEQLSAGVTLIVTTYTDGSRTTTKIFN